MLSCSLCNHSEEVLILSRFCTKCRKIKHYLSLFENRVYEVLDSVLSREISKQENKIDMEIKREIENKKNNLKVNKKIYGDDSKDYNK